MGIPKSPVSFTSRQLGTVCKVGLISDTHVPVRSKELPKEVFEVFEEVDFIVHAGDLVDISVVDQLEKIAPVLAVYGNMDGPKVREKLPKTGSGKAFDCKIGVTHNLGGVLSERERMREFAEENQFDVVVYGHTHNPKSEWVENVLFINPGSTTVDLPPFVNNPSLALLKITNGRITPEIIYI